ncbi:hypothetical protein BOX15_Mlig008581g2, partial [Macrostomum lignano]
ASSLPSVMDALRRFFESYLSSLDGIDAILLSDRCGVPLISAALPERHWTVDLVVKRGLVPSFCQAGDHANRAGLGALDCAICQFNQMTVVQMSCQPLVVTVVGRPGCNIGLASSLLSDKAFAEQVARLQTVIPTDLSDSSVQA